MSIVERVKELEEMERKLKIAWRLIVRTSDPTLMRAIMTAWGEK